MSLAMFDLTGRVALVTGGNSGIGLGYARGLVKAGAKLAIWARDEAKSAEAVAELAELGAEAAAFPCDVASEPQVIEATRATLERFGRIDACFANAGLGAMAPFLETKLEDWNRVIQINLTGAFLTFREVAKHMVARGGGGKLIATSSIGEICGMPRQEAYAATKAALSSLIRGLAVELARHDIQANAILPGWIATPATAPMKKWKALEEAVLHRTPARRWGQPEDLEGVAVYLASDASRFHTGDVLRVDGGYMVF
jgi:NAD(P)-dependent dehydrogenase (short-subunit alcohol dehydrogenase family)